MTAGIRISGLVLYPIKSCAPVQVEEVTITDHGLLYDRAWGVCDATTKNILTMKDFAAMSRIQPELLIPQGKLRITIPKSLAEDGVSERCVVEVPLEADGTETASVGGIRLWNSDNSTATILSPALDAAASKFLGRTVHIVRFVGQPRHVDPEVPVTAHPGQSPRAHLSAPAKAAIRPVEGNMDFSRLFFQDWFCLHLTSKASLQNIQVALLKALYPDEKIDPQLEEQARSAQYPALAYPIPIEKVDKSLWTPEYIKSMSILRFRPNVVLEGDALRAFEEDEWTKLQISRVAEGDKAMDMEIYIQARCGRCVIPTMNSEAGEKDGSFLPNRVLNRYRIIDPLQRFSPIFGVYGTPTKSKGFLRVGDTVQVTGRGERPMLAKPGVVEPVKSVSEAMPGVPWSNLIFVLFTVLTGVGLGLFVATH